MVLSNVCGLGLGFILLFFRVHGCFSSIFGIVSKVLLSKCFDILVASNYSESLIQSVLCLCSALPQRIKEHPARLTIWKTSRCQIKETTDEINNKDTQDNLLYCTQYWCTGVATTLKINGEQVRQIKAPPSHNKPTLRNQGNLSKQGLFRFTAVPSSGRFEASAGICLMQQEWTLMPSNSK